MIGAHDRGRPWSPAALDTPLPARRRSLLAGEDLDVIPRVERLVKRAGGGSDGIAVAFTSRSLAGR
jgi:hypothetical protein